MTQVTVPQERTDTEHTHNEMPEPPNRTLVGLFDPTGGRVPLVFERDDSLDQEYSTDDHWFDPDAEAYRWVDVLGLADSDNRVAVRLYRADDPAITVNATAGVTR